MKKNKSQTKLDRYIKGKFQPRGPKSKKEEAEFGPGKKDILVCKKCGAFYWYKSWHHSLSDYPHLKESKEIKFVLCPACQMISDKKYEGEIIIEAVPENLKEEIKNLVKKYGERATALDPLDRIISIEEEKVKRVTSARKRGALSRKEFKDLRDIRILTTENQMAAKLAKKINEICGGKLLVEKTYSHQEDVVRIRIRFPKS